MGTGIIYTKRDAFDEKSLCWLAGLFAHEHMHVAGFTHAYFAHPWRSRSVPYAIGDTVTEIAKDSMGPSCNADKR